MRRTMAIFSTFCVLAFMVSAAFAGQIHMTTVEWSAMEPGTALDPQYPRVLVLHEPTDINAEATALLRIAWVRNPGMIEQVAAPLFREWRQQGLMRIRPNGTVNWLSQANYERLDQQWRDALFAATGDYLLQTRRAVSDAEIQSMIYASDARDAQVNYTGVSGLQATWYQAVNETENPVTPGCEATTCIKCENGGNAAYCLWDECASGCAPPCKNCTTTLNLMLFMTFELQ